MDDRLRTTSSLLDNLLDWSRNEMAGMSQNPVHIDLVNLITEVVELIVPTAKSKSVSIETNLSHEGKIFADPEMIKSVMRNLISNALKFSHPGSTIRVMTENQNGQIRLSVKDEGVGMTPDQLRDVWSVKKQSTRGTGNETGTGLGLLLCKEFIDKSHGTIDVSSELGKGTQFTVSLPVQS